MVEFGEELLIDSFRIPWLIWIQVIVFFLILLLLYSFTLLSSYSPSDLSPHEETIYSPSSSSPSSSSSKKLLQQQVGEITAAGGRSLRRGHKAGNRQEGRPRNVGTNENENREGGSSGLVLERSTISSQSLFNNNDHPCNIVRIAKIAFLKCLGLDSSSTSNI